MFLTRKRTLATIYLVVLLLAAGNHYLAWNLTPGLDKKILAVIMFVGVVCGARFGSTTLAELKEYRTKQKQQRGGV